MKARLRSNGLCDGSWKSRAREVKREWGSGRQIDPMLASTAIGAWDRLPVGCAVLVVILISLLLWAILWILLWRLFGAEGVADFQQNIKRYALVYLQRLARPLPWLG